MQIGWAGEETDSSEGEDVNWDRQGWCALSEKARWYLAMSGWAFLLLMVLVFQIISYKRAAEGELDLAWRIIASGWFGVIIGLVTAIYLATMLTRLDMPISMIICPGVLCLAFLISFFVVMTLPVTQDSSIESIFTTMSIRPNCLGGKLLDVSEVLTYSAQPPQAMNVATVSTVKRVLPGQIVASDVTVEGISTVENVIITDESQFMPSKSDVTYSKKDPTVTLTIGFNQLQVFYGHPALLYTLRLNYTARLTEADCGSSIEWPQCGVWSVPEGWRENVQKDLSTGFILHCPNPGLGLSSTCSSISEGHGKYRILLNLPSVQLGTEVCPFAWTKPEQSWIWYVGAVFLCIAFCLCSVPAAGSSGDGVLFLVALIPFCIGAIICGIAYVVDSAF